MWPTYNENYEMHFVSRNLNGSGISSLHLQVTVLQWLCLNTEVVLTFVTPSEIAVEFQGQLLKVLSSFESNNNSREVTAGQYTGDIIIYILLVSDYPVNCSCLCSFLVLCDLGNMKM